MSWLYSPSYRAPAQEMPDPQILQTPLEDLLNVKVTSASLRDKSLADAPASVTVISAEQIRKHGFHTLAEALSFAPGIDDRVSLSAGLQYAGERRTCAGAVIPWMLIPEAALNTRKLAGSFEVSLVARNLGNLRLFDPVALTPRVDTVPLAGRTFLLSIVWRSTGRSGDAPRPTTSGSDLFGKPHLDPCDHACPGRRCD